MYLKTVFIILSLCYNVVSFGRSFNECDVNNDLRLDHHEVSLCQLDLDFKLIDTNKDGFLDKAELKANR